MFEKRKNTLRTFGYEHSWSSYFAEYWENGNGAVIKLDYLTGKVRRII